MSKQEVMAYAFWKVATLYMSDFIIVSPTAYYVARPETELDYGWTFRIAHLQEVSK